MASSNKPVEDTDALSIAISALSYFATQPKVLDRFFAETGLQASTIKDAAATPGFVTGVLDFVVSDDEILLAVAAEQELPPEAIVRVRQSLDASLVEDDWPPRAPDDWA